MPIRRQDRELTNREKAILASMGVGWNYLTEMWTGSRKPVHSDMTTLVRDGHVEKSYVFTRRGKRNIYRKKETGHVE